VFLKAGRHLLCLIVAQRERNVGEQTTAVAPTRMLHQWTLFAIGGIAGVVAVLGVALLCWCLARSRRCPTDAAAREHNPLLRPDGSPSSPGLRHSMLAAPHKTAAPPTGGYLDLDDLQRVEAWLDTVQTAARDDDSDIGNSSSLVRYTRESSSLLSPVTIEDGLRTPRYSQNGGISPRVSHDNFERLQPFE
jgi:hypothetical protein